MKKTERSLLFGTGAHPRIEQEGQIYFCVFLISSSSAAFTCEFEISLDDVSVLMQDRVRYFSLYAALYPVLQIDKISDEIFQSYCEPILHFSFEELTRIMIGLDEHYSGAVSHLYNYAVGDPHAADWFQIAVRS